MTNASGRKFCNVISAAVTSALISRCVGGGLDEEAPDFAKVWRAVSPKARTFSHEIKDGFTGDFIDTNLRESSAGCNFLDTVNQRAEVSCSNIWVSNKLDEVINNDDRATLNVHTSVIQSTE